jgi:hypothetical protein
MQERLTEDQEIQLQRMFPSTQIIFSKHCAIICLNNKYSLDNASITRDERCITATILDDQDTPIISITNIYAPAQAKDRMDFLENLHELRVLEDDFSGTWMILGDLNASLDRNTTIPPRLRPWYNWLQTHFNNCFSQNTPTFKRGTQRSTIDYIFAPRTMASHITNTQQHFLPTEWTDHARLTVDITLPRRDIGPGCWRFNPTLLEKIEFQRLLSNTMDLFFASVPSSQDVQDQWENLKLIVKYTNQQFSKNFHAETKDRINCLQQSRMKKLTQMKAEETQQRATEQLLEEIESLERCIEERIQDEAKQYILRSATRWQEKGERNNKYFYKVIKQRQAQQTIQALTSSKDGSTLTKTGEILEEAQSFYVKLFTPDEIEMDAVNEILSTVPEECCLNKEEVDKLEETVSKEEMLALLKHSPKSKSPGLDGIPFEVYQYLVENFAAVESLLKEVLRQAMTGKFPSSWQKTRMVLLFKKGDPLQLKNWRPLSLINTDAKLFTKLLTNRLKTLANRIINPYQSGFLPKRLISDNGWVTNTLMAHMKSVAPQLPMVSVLLDQEKAYDRVHPKYLELTLLRFGFPSTFVQTITSLFFNTQVSISINGWLAPAFQQKRGLRQGDPLSPILFNIAFEPLLRYILGKPMLRGIQLPEVQTTKRHWPTILEKAVDDMPPLKLLSYADDLQVFLNDTKEWKALLYILDLYGKASNAKVNLSKTIVISMSGKTHIEWTEILQRESINWHDKTNQYPIVQLGYPLYSSSQQLQSI